MAIIQTKQHYRLIENDSLYYILIGGQDIKLGRYPAYQPSLVVGNVQHIYSHQLLSSSFRSYYHNNFG